MSWGLALSSRLALLTVALTLQCTFAVGCTLTTELDRVQCESDRDCADRGGQFLESVCVDTWCVPEPKWSCLNRAPAAAPSTRSFPVTLRVRDILWQRPMRGVEVRLCRRADDDCAAPVVNAVTTDESGDVHFDMTLDDPALGFTGYALFTGDDILPGLYFFNPPLSAARQVPPIQLLRSSLVGPLTQYVGSSLSFERGLVIVGAVDCKGTPAAGVAMVTDDPTTHLELFYSVDGLPRSTATATDNSGYAGLINVPPGKFSITGRLEPSRRVLGTVNLIVKRGAITYSQMVPLGF